MRAIGGYFELELKEQANYPFSDFLHLNTGRNAFEYILKLRKYAKVFLPYFTCDVLLEPLRKLNIDCAFYDIDFKLEPIFDFEILKDNEGILVTNYFGLKTDFIKTLSKRIKNLIVDNAQALYAPVVEGVDAFYSPRKFVGIPDGGFVYTDTMLDIVLKEDQSYNRFSHLLKRIDLSAEEGYSDFKLNDQSLNDQPIMRMSKLTKSLLKTIDFQYIARKRIENYHYLSSYLEKFNKLSFPVPALDVPLVYPLFLDNGAKLRDKLTANRIFTATYWPNVLEWTTQDKNAYFLTKNLLALPIDQRYSRKDLETIIKTLK